MYESVFEIIQTKHSYRLHNEKLNHLYSSHNIVWVIKSRRLRWAGHAAHMGERRGVYRVLVGKPEGKIPIGRPRHRREDNIKKYLQEVGYGGMDWIDVALDRDRWWAFVNVVMNLKVPKNVGSFFTSWESVSISRRALLHEVSKYACLVSSVLNSITHKSHVI